MLCMEAMLSMDSSHLWERPTAKAMGEGHERMQYELVACCVNFQADRSNKGGSDRQLNCRTSLCLLVAAMRHLPRIHFRPSQAMGR